MFNVSPIAGIDVKRYFTRYAATETDLYIACKSFKGTEGSSVGLSTAPPVVGESETIELTCLPDSARVKSTLTFAIVIAEDVVVSWKCWLNENNLYVDVPASLPSYGSKDRWVHISGQKGVG